MLWYYQRSLIDLDAIPNFVNGVKREGVKVSPDLAFGLFSYLPLHKIRYGIKQGIVKRADAMIKRLRSWWQITIKPLFVIEAMVFLVGIIVIILGYWLKWSWTGFSAKTLWDWLQLLFVPIILAIGGFWLNRIQKSREERTTEQRAEIERKAAEQRDQTEREIAIDNQRETALQEYLDKMSELLLEKNLRKSQPEDEVRNIAWARTLTVLRGLDPVRKGTILQFLYESNLVYKGGRNIIDLKDVDLSGADLSGVKLNEANLRFAMLSRANVSRAGLRGADFTKADLVGANLRGVDLSSADLSGAYLDHAKLSRGYLQNANLRGAHLSRADLSEASLFKADFHRAQLDGANLCSANLSAAKLSVANLQSADLHGANLSEADLEGANLSKANLQGANLSGANLGPDGGIDNADLSKANLQGASLRRANLSRADVTNEQLEKAKSLQGATMPDGSKHP